MTAAIAHAVVQIVAQAAHLLAFLVPADMGPPY